MVICKEHGAHSSGPVERWGAPRCRLERPSGWACEAAERGAPWRAQARGESGISSVEIWMSVFQGVPWRRLGPRWEGAKTGCGNLQRRRWPGCGEKQESSALSPSWGPPEAPGGNLAAPEPWTPPGNKTQAMPFWAVREALPIRLGKRPENGVNCGEMQPPVSH
jgi:hypothetical protein